jgi:endonuclease-3
MATTINKQKIVTQLFSSLGKNGKGKPSDGAGRPVLEQFIYAILRENATRDTADQSFKRLKDQFFDWNEVRVSSTLEIAEMIDEELKEADVRAQRIVDFLQEIFETTYSFDLDPLMEVLQKKGPKQAAKQLSRYQAANDYSVSWVMQHSLGGHTLPVDSNSLRVLRRIGLAEEDADLEALRTSLEHQVPKAKATQFIDLISDLANSHCTDGDPTCPECPLRNVCPTGAEIKQLAATMKKPR